MQLRAAILMIAVALTACGGGQPASEPAPAAQPATQPGPGAVQPMSPADRRPAAAAPAAAAPAAAPTAAAAPAAAAASPSLYTRLGGVEAIRLVVDDFVDRVAADTRINSFFRGVDLPNLKRLITEQICSATGGPCTYSGRTMRAVHTGMNLTDDHFNALVQDLTAALDRANVPAGEKTELLTALGAMKPDIVGH